MMAPASRKLGKFEIRQKLGRGGMADVYLAQDTELGQLVALKLIENSDDSDTVSFIEAETRGAFLQARLADVDPHVVRVFGAGMLEGYFHVAMEYVDGQDLSDLTKKGKLEVEFAVDVALAVAQTLENAHKLQASIDGKNFHGIVHGDIKPKNIRINSRGDVRVLDFGIAKALSLSRKLTRNEFGSVPYASPERLESGEVNVGSDLWSLAVMMYEMVTGLQPYHAETTERLERMIRSGIAPPPAPDPCPEPLRRILIKAMAPDPELRYQSAGELGLDLAAFRAGGDVQAATEDIDATRRTYRRAENNDETRRTTGDETRRTAEPGVKETEEKPQPASRGPLFYYAMRGVAVLVLALFGYTLWAGVSDYRLYQRGLEFAHDVKAEQITDPNQIWARWTELSQGRPSSIFLRAPRTAAKDKLVAAADRVIDTYRTNESQPVMEGSWQRARTLLLHALSLDPDDRPVKSKLRLCEGHLARINGASHRSATELNDALQKFQEAQQLLPLSPDPPLGMARVYISLRDVDLAAAAFQKAETNGYPLGNRERMQLADAYRDRADRTYASTQSNRGLPQEKTDLQKAEIDYEHALKLYQASPTAKDSSTRITQMLASMDTVNTRLQQIELDENAGVEVLTKRNIVSTAIKNLIDVFRDKKKSTHPGTSHE